MTDFERSLKYYISMGYSYAIAQELASRDMRDAVALARAGAEAEARAARLFKAAKPAPGPAPDTVVKGRARTTPIPATDHEGHWFRSFNAMCVHWGIPTNVAHKRLVRGRTLRYALTAPLAGRRTRACSDHLGHEYASISAMCRAYGIPHDTFRYRVGSGWDLKKALETPLKKPVRSHQ